MIKNILLFFLFLSISVGSFASETTDSLSATPTAAKEKFRADKMIIDHIVDAYEWHITTIGEHHISIPLPVILYSKTSGFHCFMSSKFHHGEKMVNNFKIAKEKPYEGKIVEIVNGKEVRPYDLSITKNVVALLFSMVLILWIFLSVAKRYKTKPNTAPKGLQSFIEPVVLFVRDDIAKSSIGEERYEKFTPYLLSIFFFIWINNMLGLIPFFPGGANITGNITITMLLAVFTFIITTFSGNKHYWQEIFNNPVVPWWLKIPIPLMPVVEFIGIFTKPFVLMVRLFANMSAGHIVALGFYSLIFIFGHMSIGAGYGISIVSLIFTIFMALLELLVAFIQAYVFTLLSALYFGMARPEESH